MADLDDQLEQLQRQVEEFEALAAVFPDCSGSPTDSGGLLLSECERQALDIARSISGAALPSASSGGNSGHGATVPNATLNGGGGGTSGGRGGDGNGGSSDGDNAGWPLLSGTIRLPDLLYCGQPVALRFSLPRAYPAGRMGPPAAPRDQTGLSGDGTEDCGRARSACTGLMDVKQLSIADSGCAASKGTASTGGSDRCPDLEVLRARQALLAVECGGPRSSHERLSGVVRVVSEEQAEAGCECVLLAVDALKEAVEELLSASPPTFAHESAGSIPATATPTAAAAGGNPAASAPGNGLCNTDPSAAAVAVATEHEPEGLLCVLVWLHHLKSLTKRKLIVSWARELELAGACKPGFPGVVVVEGHSTDVREFLGRMRGLSWQAMQVRGEDLLPLTTTITNTAGAAAAKGAAASSNGIVSSGGGGGGGDGSRENPVSGAAAQGNMMTAAAIERLRRLRSPLPFVELTESGMSELGALCRTAGLNHVFMSALKL